jgi:aminopeptidase N
VPSSGNFCTQCEAEGFRRITYFPGPPRRHGDAYTTTLVADRNHSPCCSPTATRGPGRLDDGRHCVNLGGSAPQARYLFALVAGDLACAIEDRFVTLSGREVRCASTSSPQIDKCDHAMAAR